MWGFFLGVVAVVACGEVKGPPDGGGTGNDGLPVPVTAVAPGVDNAMYQGSQTQFKTQLGTMCTGRVAASMGGTGFCFLAADDNVKCAGVIGTVDFGMLFSTVGQASAVQIMVMFFDNGMCITKTDHTVVCMGNNTNVFGNGITTQFSRWTAHSDIAAIGSGTWDQICGITMAGQVFCGSNSSAFGNPPVNIGAPGQTSMWVDTSGAAHLSDTNVLRPSESRTSCQIKANGFACEGGTLFGPTNGTIVNAVSGGTDPMNPTACWLSSDGSVSCTNGPRFQPGKVVYLAGDVYTDSLCAIYNDGSVWCIGSNSNGKLGTGNSQNLGVETMVAPPGSARVKCE